MPRSRFFLTLIFALVTPLPAYGDVYISEFMFDLAEGSDTGREWIEVFNAGSESVNLTEWKLFEANVNHGIAASSGGETLGSGAYAIIADNPAKFLADWPGFSGIVFDSAFSLSNTGEDLEIRNSELAGSGVVSYTSSPGGAGDGNSLHRSSTNSATYTAGAPTPGSGALVVDGSSTQDVVSESTQSPSSPEAQAKTTVSSYVPPITPQVFAYAGKDRDVISGAEVTFEGKAYDKEGQPLSDSKSRFMWTFGDGSTAEGASVRHTFFEPGRYAVVLNISEVLHSASHRIVVNAHPVSVEVLNTDGKITLVNKSGRDIDLSRWFLRSMNGTFNIPENTILLSGAKIVFPQIITKLVAADDAALLYPSGNVAAQVGVVVVPVVAATTIEGIERDTSPVPSEIIKETQVVLEGDDVAVEEDESNEMVAAAAGTTTAAAWWLGALGIGILGGGIVVAVRRMTRQEWEILEENE